MSTMEGRIVLQQSRFNLIQDAAEFNHLDGSRITRQLLNTRLDMLEQNWNKFQEEHGNLCLSESSSISEHPYVRERVYERCQAFYVYSRAKLLTQRDEMDSREGQASSTNSDVAPVSNSGPITSLMPRSALPRISLPHFSGDYQSWRSFHDLFSSIILENSLLTNVEKMHYLKTSLSGEAARLVSNLPVSHDNFQVAWQLLVTRYENKRFLITAQLDRIFNIKPLKTKSAKGLSALLTTISEASGALRALGCSLHSWDPILLYHLVRLLDSETREAWEVQLGSSSAFPTYVQFEEFLISRTRALENLGLHTATTSKELLPSYADRQRNRVVAHHATPSTSSGPSHCPLCNSLHHLSKCNHYQTKTPQQRRDIVKKHRRCFNCLGPHISKKCPVVRRCFHCGAKHHTSIHTATKDTTTQHSISEGRTTRRPTLLATSRALLLEASGNLHAVRILLDQGSELSFITEDLARRANLSRKTASLPLLGIGGTYSGRTKGIVSIHLQSCHDPSLNCVINAYVLPRLTSKLPPCDVTCGPWPHLNGLQLADPDFSRSGSIHIVIGSDYYGNIIMPGLRQGDSSSPVAQRTLFGWVLSGPISSDEVPLTAQAHHCTVDQELQDLLTRFWIQEETPKDSPPTLTLDEEKCERHFVSTHTRDATGRYTVRLPLKADPTILGESKGRALACLRQLTRRLLSDSTYRQLYSEFMEEYKNLGHMRALKTKNEEPPTVYYLPHHGVYRDCSSTTKLRVVFNGSSKTSNGLSLNDILYPGAKLQQDISDVLLWIRTHRYIFSTDVVKMFRQIAVHRDDRDLQRILWYETGDHAVSFQLTTVTYGLSCAPFLALRTMQQLVNDEGHRFPKAVAPLTRGRYVDDIFGGADSISELREIIRQLTLLCEAGGFPLQKWNSNCVTLLPHTDDATAAVEFEPTLLKVLGLVWKPHSDTFHYTISSFTSTTLTKRIIASEIAKLYDPLGMISPILIRAKILLQELWLLKVGWDEPLPPETQHRWATFRQQLQQLNKVSIPRWLGIVRDNAEIELHGFSDASQWAMAAVIYLRVKSDHKSHVQLVCSKTRVAPLKRLTIPRLELAAALLLARLLVPTRKALELDEVPVFCWTDSSVVLTWITAHPSRWKDFVRNRVAAIQEELPRASWRYVPSKGNPADCASRGLRPDQLSQCEQWWKGPDWISDSTTSWPATQTKPAPEADLEERPGQVFLSVTKQPAYWTLLDKYSSLQRLLRVTATCSRFLSCLRCTPRSSLTENPLTPMEIEQSRLLWIQIVQQVWFYHEIGVLSRGDILSRSNPLGRLAPFIDKNGLLRVGGRLQNAPLDLESKHPLILPRKSPLTTLIIDDAHHRTLHGGTQDTLCLIRRSYWLVGGRAPVRARILRCGRCARYRGIRAKQLMGQLPAARVTPSRPFCNAGLDYAGPVTLKTFRGRAARRYKGYLAIFVCLATSAVHIEVVTDYTTEAFIAAYKRFTGRRGICQTLQSDCGTNFVGANAELRRRFEASATELRELASLLANDGTEWKFNPPAAPHFGGKWEAAVKSTKHHLRRMIGDTVLTYEELTTVIVQIEAVLNSRPLCPLSDDVTDLSALTPGHFLVGEALTTVPEPDLTTMSTSRLSRWQILKQKVDTFWTRWSKECLQRYLAISKWHHPSHEIKVGSLVLITDERYPPGKWPLARVLQLHVGPDGLTRVVTVKTATSTFKRPVVKLCVLPTDPDLDNSTILSPKAGGNVAE